MKRSNPHPASPPSPVRTGEGPKPIRPDTYAGGKLPEWSLWEQLMRAGCALEFCSQFFNSELSYPKARRWLLSRGIKISVNALSGFYNSLPMRMRYASLQAAASAETARKELPADLDKATRDRIAQHKFELAFMNLSEQHRLELIQIQQNEDSAKGNYELKKMKLDLDRIKIQRTVIKHFLDWYDDKQAKEILSSNLSHADKIEKLGQTMFGEDWK